VLIVAKGLTPAYDPAIYLSKSKQFPSLITARLAWVTLVFPSIKKPFS